MLGAPGSVWIATCRGRTVNAVVAFRVRQRTCLGSPDHSSVRLRHLGGCLGLQQHVGAGPSQEYIYTYTCIHISIDISVCLSVFLSIFLSVCLSVCMCACMHVCTYTKIYVYITEKQNLHSGLAFPAPSVAAASLLVGPRFG